MGKGDSVTTGTIDPVLYPLMRGSSGALMRQQRNQPLDPYFDRYPARTAGLDPYQRMGMGMIPGLMEADPTEALGLQQLLRLPGLAGAGPTTGYEDPNSIPSMDMLMDFLQPEYSLASEFDPDRGMGRDEFGPDPGPIYGVTENYPGADGGPPPDVPGVPGFVDPITGLGSVMQPSTYAPPTRPVSSFNSRTGAGMGSVYPTGPGGRQFRSHMGPGFDWSGQTPPTIEEMPEYNAWLDDVYNTPIFDEAMYEGNPAGMEQARAIAAQGGVPIADLYARYGGPMGMQNARSGGVASYSPPQVSGTTAPGAPPRPTRTVDRSGYEIGSFMSPGGWDPNVPGTTPPTTPNPDNPPRDPGPIVPRPTPGTPRGTPRPPPGPPPPRPTPAPQLPPGPGPRPPIGELPPGAPPETGSGDPANRPGPSAGAISGVQPGRLTGAMSIDDALGATSGRISRGLASGEDPAIAAARSNFEMNIAPMIQDQSTAAGLGRSSTVGNALARGWGEISTPLMLDALARGERSVEGEYGRRERSAERTAAAAERLGNTLMGYGQTRNARRFGAIDAAMGAGQTRRDIQQGSYDARYNDMLRRQALAEQSQNIPFSGLATALTGQRTSSGGLFKIVSWLAPALGALLAIA